MLTANMSFKRPKLTVQQKALKKSLGPISKDLKLKIRADMPRASGALQWAVDFKVKGGKGRGAYSVIGVRSKYSKAVKGVEKIPNLYAAKAGAKAVIEKYVNRAAIDQLNSEISKNIKELLK
jgi:hypothetical protein